MSSNLYDSIGSAGEGLPPSAAVLQERVAPAPRRLLPSYAALDLGTNNCRLLIARRAGSAFRVIDAFSRIVRLGEGLAAAGALSEAAMAPASEALRGSAAKI